MKTLQELLQSARAAGHSQVVITINDDIEGSFGTHTRVALGVPGFEHSAVDAEVNNTTFLTKAAGNWFEKAAPQTDETPIDESDIMTGKAAEPAPAAPEAPPAAAQPEAPPQAPDAQPAAPEAPSAPPA